jgi:hypothetical protein
MLDEATLETSGPRNSTEVGQGSTPIVSASESLTLCQNEQLPSVQSAHNCQLGEGITSNDSSETESLRNTQQVSLTPGRLGDERKIVNNSLGSR